jgi:hypothetical protein
MRRLVFVLTALGLAAALPLWEGHAAPPRKVEDLMKKKLAESQKVLAGLATHDFDKVVSSAEELIEISKQAEWKVLKTPLYQVYSDEFKRNAEDLVKNAKKKSVDATALSYVDLTLTCVKCHKHVREKRVARGE